MAANESSPDAAPAVREERGSERLADESPPAAESPPAPKRLMADSLLGIVLPTVCVLIDHFVVRFVFANFSLRFSCYLFMLLQMFVFLIWSIGRHHLGAWAAPAAGVLLAGTMFALSVGLALLPFSLLGAVIGVGLLGLSPFAAAVVFYRSFRDAMRIAREHATPCRRRGWISLAFVLIIVLPLAAEKSINMFVERAAMDILSPSAEKQAAGRKTLDSFQTLADYRIKDFSFLSRIIELAPNTKARSRIEAAVAVLDRAGID